MASTLRAGDWPVFGLWAVSGVLCGLGLVGLWSAATLLVVPGLLLGGFLAWHLGVVRETFGLLSGLSAIPWSLLYENPFDACLTIADPSLSCPAGSDHTFFLVATGTACAPSGGIAVMVAARTTRRGRVAT